MCFYVFGSWAYFGHILGISLTYIFDILATPAKSFCKSLAYLRMSQLLIEPLLGIFYLYVGHILGLSLAYLVNDLSYLWHIFSYLVHIFFVSGTGPWRL